MADHDTHDPGARLDARLAGLADGPLPPLADPAGVRARGERLRRRRQAGFAAAAVLVVVALGGGAAALTTPGDADALRQAAPTPSLSPDVSPPPSPALSTSPSPAPSPSLAPSSSPAPPPEPTRPPAPTVWAPADALLTPAQASAAELPGWSPARDQGPGHPPGPFIDPCGTRTFPGEPVETAQIALRAQSESGDRGLGERVSRMLDEAAARAAFDDLVDAFARCPGDPAAGGARRYEVVDRGEEAGVRRALVRVEPCGTPGCLDAYRGYLLLAQAGSGVAEATYNRSDDSDPRELAFRMARAVAAQLGRTAG